MKFEFKTEPFKHQQKALELSAMKKNFAYFMEMGCVDGETEFLTNRGWMKFKDFDINKIDRPFLVAQIEPTDIKDYFNLTFVPPISFIKGISFSSNLLNSTYIILSIIFRIFSNTFLLKTSLFYQYFFLHNIQLIIS